MQDTEQDVAYKGFAAPGDKDGAQRAQVEGRQVVARFDLGDGGGAPVVAMAR